MRCTARVIQSVVLLCIRCNTGSKSEEGTYVTPEDYKKFSIALLLRSS